MSETRETICGFDWGLGEDSTVGVLLDRPPDGHAYTIREIVFQKEGPPVLRYDLVATGIICSPSWVLNQDDDEGEDEHDNEADGLVKCGDCKGSGEYVGLTTRERCSECDGSGWV